MESYGLKSIGRIICQVLDRLPTYQSKDLARFVYVKEDSSLYFGASTKWVKILDNDILNLGNIESNDVKLANVLDYFDDSCDSIEDALNYLCTGVSFRDQIIVNRHYGNESITADKIRFGTNTNEVNATNIIGFFNSKNMSLQDVLSILQTQITAKKEYYIDECSWAYDSARDLYFYSLSSESSWSTMFPVYRCYYNGEVIEPVSVLVNAPGKIITFYLTHRMSIHVTLVV